MGDGGKNIESFSPAARCVVPSTATVAGPKKKNGIYFNLNRAISKICIAAVIFEPSARLLRYDSGLRACVLLEC